MTVTIGRVGESVPGAIHVRVDRASILGNPYKIDSRHDRDAVCDSYRSYFYNQLRKNPRFRNTVWALKREHQRGNHVVLQCHCAPERCHAETIREYLEK